jgi:hypothetical protein
MKYKFLGRPDYKFPNLKTGKIYDLHVGYTKESLKLPFFLNWLFPYREKPVIVKPFYCPYSSWESFYQNWIPYEKHI